MGGMWSGWCAGGVGCGLGGMWKGMGGMWYGWCTGGVECGLGGMWSVCDGIRKPVKTKKKPLPS